MLSRVVKEHNQKQASHKDVQGMFVCAFISTLMAQIVVFFAVCNTD